MKKRKYKWETASQNDANKNGWNEMIRCSDITESNKKDEIKKNLKIKIWLKNFLFFVCYSRSFSILFILSYNERSLILLIRIITTFLIILFLIPCMYDCWTYSSFYHWNKNNKFTLWVKCLISHHLCSGLFFYYNFYFYFYLFIYLFILCVYVCMIIKIQQKGEI